MKRKITKQPDKEVSEDEADMSEEDEDSLDEMVSDDEDEDDDEQQEEDLGSDAEDENGEDANDSESEEIKGEDKQHKAALEKLKKADPSFYKFLEENDKDLLNFNASDSEDSDNSDDDAEKVHKTPTELEVDSEESDFEDDGSDIGAADGQAQITVTLKMVENWTTQLQEENSMGTLSEVVKAFHACIQRITGSEEKEQPSKYRVSGSAVFNAIVQMCVLEMQPAIRRFLKLQTSMTHAQPSKSKRWNKIRGNIKSYVTSLVKLVSRVSSDHIQAVTLKHMHQMAVFVAAFPSLSRIAVRRLVTLWSEGASQDVRILAFLCIARLACDRHNQQLEFVIKLMYVTYVRNCKFVSPNVLPGINFMRRSLVELFAIDEAAAYQHVFLYVRQLAIHLRNAITTQKKETVQTVYNWQYVNSLHLWCELLGNSSEISPLRSLVYPVVQVALGVIKLVPTAQYYPLRFHIARMLTSLSRRSRVFVPVLPMLLDVLSGFDFNSRHKKVSMKPLDLMCVLRASKLQQQENGFKDSVMDHLYSTLLEYLSAESHSIAFPDLVLPTVMQIRQFLKKCKVGTYCKRMRSLLDKIEENSKFVDKERAASNLKLSDARSVASWELALKNKGTPLESFYESWNKASKQKGAQLRTGNHKLAEDYDVPTIKKHAKKPYVQSDGPPDLFPSDEEDSDIGNFGGSDEEEEEPQPKRTKRGKRVAKEAADIPSSPKVTKKVGNDILAFPDSGDIVEEFKLSDYE